MISYFSILEDTLVGFLLPAFQRSIRKQQRTNPKVYYFDTGIKRAPERTLEVPFRPATYEYRKAFEHFLVTQIVHLATSATRWPCASVATRRACRSEASCACTGARR